MTQGRNQPDLVAVRRSASEAETRLIGESLGLVLRGGDVLLLDGALGAGKTTLVRAIAEGMRVESGGVASPTYVLIHQYRSTCDGPALIHVDAYRLKGGEELETIGWDRVLEQVKQGSAVLIIEWAERLGPAVPAGAGRLRLEHISENERELSLELPGSWASRPGIQGLLNRLPTVCPVTGKRVPADSPTYPFATERARLADLYKWFSGSYQVSRELTEEDIEDPPEMRSDE